MFSGLSPLDTMFQTQPALFGFGSGPMDLSADFSSIYKSLLAQKTSLSADSAKRSYLQAQFSKQQVLYDMFEDPKSSFLGYGVSNMFGAGGLFGLPSWTFDAARVLGDPTTQNLLNLSQQAAALTQARYGSLNMMNVGNDYSSLF